MKNMDLSDKFRAYAVGAPVQIPDWFEPDMAKIGERPTELNGRLLGDWPDEPYSRLLLDSMKACEEWDTVYRIERFFQWRIFYGNNMLGREGDLFGR